MNELENAILSLYKHWGFDEILYSLKRLRPASPAKLESIRVSRERCKLAYELCHSGKTYKEVGAIMGVSANRIMQLVRNHKWIMKHQQREQL